MPCSRCSHPLPPRADRCLRCFALNPQNRGTEPLPPPRPAGRAAAGKEPDAGRIDFRAGKAAPAYSAELPPGEAVHQLDLSFEDLFAEAEGEAAAPAVARRGDAAELPTEPPRPRSPARPSPAQARPLASAQAPRPVSPPVRPVSPPAARPIPRLAPAVAEDGAEAEQPWPTAFAWLAAWAFDGAALAACFALHVALAAAVVGVERISPGGPQSVDTWADLLLFARRLPLLWGLFLSCLAIAYSWAFVAVAGRTPGMLLAGLRVVRVRRGRAVRVPVLRALIRSALALPSLLLGALGFVLALFDARGQSLHDRLTGCRVVADARALRPAAPTV